MQKRDKIGAKTNPCRRLCFLFRECQRTTLKRIPPCLYLRRLLSNLMVVKGAPNDHIQHIIFIVRGCRMPMKSSKEQGQQLQTAVLFGVGNCFQLLEFHSLHGYNSPCISGSRTVGCCCFASLLEAS